MRKNLLRLLKYLFKAKHEEITVRNLQKVEAIIIKQLCLSSDLRISLFQTYVMRLLIILAGTYCSCRKHSCLHMQQIYNYV